MKLITILSLIALMNFSSSTKKGINIDAIECIATNSVSQWEGNAPHAKESIAVWAENTCTEKVKFEIQIVKKSNNQSVYKRTFTLKGKEKKLILKNKIIYGSPSSFKYQILSQVHP